MGWDIYGWIEVYDEDEALDGREPWQAVINIGYLASGRDYDAFGCLFGVQNYAQFRPIAPERGLPADLSALARQELEQLQEIDKNAAAWPSWVTWAELKAMDWDEPAERPDGRIHVYARQPDGTLRFERKAAFDGAFTDFIRSQLGPDAVLEWREGAEWTDGDTIYRMERLKRSDVRGYWQPILNMMEHLARTYGDERVRLVVWFTF